MEMMVLKYGTEVPMPTYLTTKITVEDLMDSHPIAWYELTQLCRNSAHDLFGNTAQVLNSVGLVHDGKVHDDTRAVVLYLIGL